jgi:NAD-dependent DNA ligase
MLDELLEELRELKAQLTEHDYRYYVLFNPIITDQKYDAMYKEYQELLEVVVGKDTKSLESMEKYPDWVRYKLGETPNV